jgi:membrane-associated phospholipid phosphatase
MHHQLWKIIHLRFLVVALLAIHVYPTAIFAQDSTGLRPNILEEWPQMGKTLFQPLFKLMPGLSMAKKDFLKLGGVFLISGATMLVDKQVYVALQRNQNHTLDKLENVGDFLGQPEYNYPFMLALWASGVIVNNDWLRDTGIMVIASVTTSGLLQTFAKEAVGRSRPGSGRGPFNYKPFAGEVDYHSFPSGHTMLSVATAWILARQVNFLPLKIIFYSMPVITGASRVYVGAHWLSDIVLGSALGIACAESVLRLYPMIKEKNKYSFTLVPSGNGVGMVLKF